MTEFNTHAGNLRLIGGRLCLDFVNTVDDHRRAEPKDYLADYGALLAWARHCSLLPAAPAGQAGRYSAGAASALDRAKQLRGALWRLFRSAGNHLAANDLATLNAALARLPQSIALVPKAPGPGCAWEIPAEPLDALLWPVAISAAELLASPDRSLVRECAGQGCSWLFLDTSRNRSRRWCSMDDCGNRAKARRHYAQRRAAIEAPNGAAERE